MMRTALALVFMTAAALTSGCASMMDPVPDDPKFAPALPEDTVADIVPDGSIFGIARPDNLYTDIKAHRVGDIISVEYLPS